MSDHDSYAKMRKGARRTAEDMFSSESGNSYWDDLYDRAVSSADAPRAMAASY